MRRAPHTIEIPARDFRFQISYRAVGANAGDSDAHIDSVTHRRGPKIEPHLQRCPARLVRRFVQRLTAAHDSSGCEPLRELHWEIDVTPGGSYPRVPAANQRRVVNDAEFDESTFA